MNTKKLLTIITLILAVFITAKAALGDISVTTTPGSAVETVLYTYDINVIDNDAAPKEIGVTPQFTNLQAVGFTPVGTSYSINPTTGVFTWTPGQEDAGIRQFSVEINDTDSAPESNAPLLYTFSVNVANDIAPGVSVSDILFDQVDRGNNVTVTVTVSNTGNTAALTGVTSELLNVNSRYQASIIGTLPATIAPGASATVQLQVFVPLSEDSGNENIGSFRVNTHEGTQTKTITINPKSYLTIDRVRVNDESSGKFNLENVNTFDVKVSNDFTEDLENVVVTVKVLDVDGDDIEEESDSFDINNGDHEDIPVEIDLRGESVSEDEYTVEVTVEGEDSKDGGKHTATEELTVKVDRESHKVVIRSASLTNNILENSGATTVLVTVENIGKHDEDNVEVRVHNSALNVDMNKNDIELDKASGSDNEYKSRFNLNLQDAKEGTYTLTVEVLRDGDVEDTEELTLEVRDSGKASTVKNEVVTDNTAADQLKENLLVQLQQHAEAKKVTETSFRESNMYLYLLGGLTALVFVAVVMAVGVLVIRKR